MATRTRSVQVVVVIALVAIILALVWSNANARQAVRLRDERLLTIERTQQNDAAHLNELKVKLAAAEQELAKLRAAGNSANAATAKTPITNQSTDITSYMEALPGFAEYRERVYRDRLLMRYGDLRRLNLPPEKLAQLERLLIDQLNAPMDARAAALKMGYANGSPEMQRAIGEAMREVDKDIRELMGKSGMADLTAASMQASAIAEVQAQLNQKLILSGTPLSADQVKAMADILAADRSAPRTAQGTSEHEDALLARVAQVLTPEQFEIYRQDRATRAMQTSLSRQALEAAKKAVGHDVNSWSLSGP